EYTAKKQKILNQKIEISEKLKDFERKGNRWLELCKNFILTANQAQIAALQGNFSEKKNFLKKIGSNLLLRERRVFVEYKNPWKLLENSSAETRGEAPSEAGNRNFTNWLGGMDSNHHAMVQNLEKLSPEGVPEDKNTGLNDGPRSGSNKQNEANETV
ncbi:hypothetical protein KKG58_00090, partial [Patescibacteria group bacterium]|nr:hypothetical protein [Patescibacteria group bacterium]